MHVLIKPIVFMTFSFSLVSLGSWTNGNGNVSDNVTRFKLDRSYSSLLICQILAIFFRSWTLKNCIEVYKKKNKIVVFFFSRYSRAVTVKKCTKKRDANWVGPNRSDRVWREANQFSTDHASRIMFHESDLYWHRYCTDGVFLNRVIVIEFKTIKT